MACGCQGSYRGKSPPILEGVDPVSTEASSQGLTDVHLFVYNLAVSQDAGGFPLDLPSYISGYVDGEGCFTVSFSPRVKMRGGWEVRPSFSVSQNNDRAEVLCEMLDYFGCGSVRPDRSDRTVKFEIRDIRSLQLRVIPHFRVYPLRSSKKDDFERFAAVCDLVSRGMHLIPTGFREIVMLAMHMNPSGKRRFTQAHLLGRSGSQSYSQCHQ